MLLVPFQELVFLCHLVWHYAPYTMVECLIEWNWSCRQLPEPSSTWTQNSESIKRSRMWNYLLKNRRGPFSSLYPWEYHRKLIHLATHLQGDGRPGTKSRAGSLSTSGNIVKVYKVSWADPTKRRLCAENILLEYFPLSQKWMLRTCTNREYPVLEILDI